MTPVPPKGSQKDFDSPASLFIWEKIQTLGFILFPMYLLLLILIGVVITGIPLPYPCASVSKPGIINWLYFIYFIILIMRQQYANRTTKLQNNEISTKL